MAAAVEDAFTEAERLKDEAAKVLADIRTLDETRGYYEEKAAELVDKRLRPLRARTRRDVVVQTLDDRSLVLRSRMYSGLHTCVILVNVAVLVLLIAVLGLQVLFPGSRYS